MRIKLVLKNENSSQAETTLFLEDAFIAIGRNPSATVVLRDKQIAPEQAVIINENGRPVFFNQANGTIFNGRNLEQGVRREISDGDRLQIGSYRLFIFLEQADRGKNTSERELTAASQEDSMLNFLPGNAASDDAAARRFTDIFNNLVKEKDQFYFQFAGGDETRRLPIQGVEIPLGWDDEDGDFSTSKETVRNPHAVLRKDSTGVTIYPHGSEAILLNGVLLEAGRRLRNGDRLLFTRTLAHAKSEEVALVFCEHAAPVEVNSMLPREPLSNTLQANRTLEIPAEITQPIMESITDSVSVVSPQKNNARKNSYLGYFTLVEILIMIFATVLTAALTFLLLEYS